MVLRVARGRALIGVACADSIYTRVVVCVAQEPILALLRKHIDSKGKQAKLKSPQELQELLDVTRQLVRALDLSALRRKVGASPCPKALAKP